MIDGLSGILFPDLLTGASGEVLGVGRAVAISAVLFLTTGFLAGIGIVVHDKTSVMNQIKPLAGLRTGLQKERSQSFPSSFFPGQTNTFVPGMFVIAVPQMAHLVAGASFLGLGETFIYFPKSAKLLNFFMVIPPIVYISGR